MTQDQILIQQAIAKYTTSNRGVRPSKKKSKRIGDKIHLINGGAGLLAVYDIVGRDVMPAPIPDDSPVRIITISPCEHERRWTYLVIAPDYGWKDQTSKYGHAIKIRKRWIKRIERLNKKVTQ